MKRPLPASICLAFGVILLQGCASAPPVVRLTPSSGQELVYYKGDPCIEAEASTDTGPVWVSVCATALNVSRATLHLRFASSAQESITLDEGIITAQHAGKEVDVMAYTELAAEERSRQIWAAVGAGLAAASNNMAAQQAGYSSYSGSAQTNAYAYGSGGYATAKATTNFSGTTYNAGAAYAAQANANAENARLMSSLQAQNALRNQQIGEALRTHTLAPGSSYGTYVDIRYRPAKQPQPARVRIAFAGAELTFDLEIQKSSG